MSELRLTVLLVSAAAFFAALAIWPWLPSATALRPGAGAAGPAAGTGTIAALPPLANFAATIERPLFSPSRRPAAADRPAPAGTSIEIRYRLQGLVTAGHERRALLKEAAGQHRLEVGEGDMVEGWTVKRIEQDRLVLSSPSGEATLTLGQAGAGAPTRP